MKNETRWWLRDKYWKIRNALEIFFIYCLVLSSISLPYWGYKIYHEIYISNHLAEYDIATIHGDVCIPNDTIPKKAKPGINGVLPPKPIPYPTPFVLPPNLRPQDGYVGTPTSSPTPTFNTPPSLNDSPDENVPVYGDFATGIETSGYYYVSKDFIL